MNMKKLLMIIGTAVLMSACVKPVEPKEIRFSVLGDSYSTYVGYVDPETNDVFPYDTLGFLGGEQMWWHILATEMGWSMEKNNSFSGSLVSNFRDFSAGNYYAPHSFLRRMDNLGSPDVIFVFGATNDATVHNGDHIPVVPLGDYVYADWTEDQLTDFRPALAYLFDCLRRSHPQAKLYFLLDMDLGSGGISVERKNAFIESIHQIARHYDVDCIDLVGIRKIHWHPDVKGQKDIASQVIEYLELDFNV